jgi:hypothetical protein
MGGPHRIDFGTQSNAGRYGPDTGPRHINAFVEKVEEGQPNYPIYATEGLDSFATITNGTKCRGMVSSDSTLYSLVGTVFSQVNSAGVVTVIGGIAGQDDVFMARNSVGQVAIVGNGIRYIYDGTTLSTITDSDLPPPTGTAFSDQRLLYSVADGRLFWSDIDAAGDINALSFATAEAAPDGLSGVFTHKIDIWLPGTRTTEVWRSTANADDPFQRVAGGVIPHGCPAPHSMKNVGDVIFWVNDKDQVVATAAYMPQVVSNHAVSRSIAAVDDKSTIVGFAYFSGGTGHYVITCDEWTWQYNTTTQRWFERQSYGMPNWRARHSAPLGGNWIVGDQSAGVLYRIDPDTFDENGQPMVMTLRSAPVHAWPNRICVDRLLLNFVTGVGLNSTDEHESDPQIGMRFSDDGGRSWSNQLTRSLGAEGAYETRVTFDGLGCTGRQGRIWELQCSAPVVRSLRYAAIEGDVIGT